MQIFLLLCQCVNQLGLSILVWFLAFDKKKRFIARFVTLFVQLSIIYRRTSISAPAERQIVPC